MYFPNLSEAMKQALKEFESQGGKIKVIPTNPDPEMFAPKVVPMAGMFSGGRRAPCEHS